MAANTSRIRTNAGAPGTGTAAVWTLTIGGSPVDAETFRLSVGGLPTAPIAWSATNATLVANVDAALEAILGSGSVTTAVGTMTGGVGTITITFAVKKPTLTLAVHTNSTSGTVAIAQTTAGVAPTGNGVIGKGGMVTDVTNGKLYINTGTAAAPTWTVVGSQS